MHFPWQQICFYPLLFYIYSNELLGGQAAQVVWNSHSHGSTSEICSPRQPHGHFLMWLKGIKSQKSFIIPLSVRKKLKIVEHPLIPELQPNNVWKQPTTIYFFWMSSHSHFTSAAAAEEVWAIALCSVAFATTRLWPLSKEKKNGRTIRASERDQTKGSHKHVIS